MAIFVKALGVIGGVILVVFTLSFSLRQKAKDGGLLEIPKISQETSLQQATTSKSQGEVKNALGSTARKSMTPVLPKEEIVIPPKIVPEAKAAKEIPPVSPSAETETEVIGKTLPRSSLTRPPLDKEAIMSAVVKIQCPADEVSGKYVGSGFVLKNGVVVTAAHVVKDSVSKVCDVIFSKNRRPIHYLRGTLEDLPTISKRHNEEGIDVATLTLPPLDEYPEARAIFSDYPKIPYPICDDPQMIGDKLLHFGYPSNYVDQNYLSSQEGEAVTHADVNGIKEQLSEDKTFVFKSPIFSYTSDETGLHPYMVSRVASFYGDSGGLAFNASKQCIIGPHRGGTIGRGAGENYSVFINLGWVKNQLLDF